MEKESITVKTFNNWKGSLTDYLQVGDIVDGEIVDHCFNVMPPACFTSTIIQMGEPDHHVNGRATYVTLHKTDHGWMYVGCCHRGEIVEPTANAI